MANLPSTNDNVRHWLLSAVVLCGLAGAVVGQTYLNRVREPYIPPPILAANQKAPGVLWRAARASAVADAYNRASDAVRSDNRVALADALEDLRQLKAASRAEPLALAAAEEIVSEAGQLDMQAQKLKGAQAKKVQAQAALRYREALRMSPRFNSSNPNLVNAAGYFLAERGSTPADFREAERLTRRALELHDKEIKGSPKDDEQRLAAKLYSRANTRDSLAWALYRQGRYEEALREQKQAVFEATLSSKAFSEPVPAELHFHLGEIYRSLKRWDDAREQYQIALELKPEDVATQQALKRLPSKTREVPSKKPKSLPLPRLPEPEDAEPEVPGVPKTGPLIA